MFSNLYSWSGGSDEAERRSRTDLGRRRAEIYGVTSTNGNSNLNYGTVFKISTNSTLLLSSPQPFFNSTTDGASRTENYNCCSEATRNCCRTRVNGGAEYPLDINTVTSLPVFIPFVGSASGFGTLFQMTTNGALTT